MPLEKMICGENYTTELLKDNVNGLIDKANTEVLTMVMLGASIMNSAFDTPSDVDRVKSLYGFKTVSVVDESDGGDTSADLLARLQPILDVYSGVSGVVFCIHIGGNDVSALRPYSTAGESDLYAMASNIQMIVDMIQASGHCAILSNITYRSYSGGETQEGDGSLPFNTNIIDPIIKTKLNYLWDYSTGIPLIDMYNFTKDNQQYLLPDGIHLTTDGEDALRHYWFSRLTMILKAMESRLDPSSGAKIVIDFNDETSYPQNNPSIAASGERTFQAATTHNIDGVVVAILNRNGLNSAGRGNPGDISTSLLNDALLRSNVYTTDQVMVCTFSNIKVGTSGILRVTASRAVNDSDRVGEYTVQGVTKTINAASTIPEIIDFNFTTDEFGSFSLYVDRQDGSSFAYLSGVEIEFN